MTEQEFCEQYAKYKNTVYSVIFNYVQKSLAHYQKPQECSIRGRYSLL